LIRKKADYFFRKLLKNELMLELPELPVAPELQVTVIPDSIFCIYSRNVQTEFYIYSQASEYFSVTFSTRINRI